MSMFLRAYVSVQDVWPHPLVDTSSRVWAWPTGPTCAGPQEAGTAKHGVPGALGRDGVTSPPHPAAPAAPEVLWDGAVCPRGSSVCSWSMSDFSTIMAGAAGTGCMSAKGWGVYLGWPVQVGCFTHLR